MPNMLAAEAAAADGQKLLSPVAPAMMRPRRTKIQVLPNLRFEIHLSLCPAVSINFYKEKNSQQFTFTCLIHLEK